MEHESEELKAELDRCIASECPLCGDIMIKSIFKPLFRTDDLELVRSWEV